VVSRLREAFAVEVQLRSLFELPTVSALAAHIDAALQAEEGVESPPIRPVARTGELPLSYAQQRLWFLDQLEPESAFYNSPVALRLSGQLNIEALQETLSEIIRRHEVLRTSFPALAGKPVQVIAPTVHFSLPVRDLSQLEEFERERQVIALAQQEAARPFDLSSGLPLLRSYLLKLQDEEYVMLFTMHHIASDGWSIGVLLREVAALYEAYSQRRSSPLPDLAIQYADFAVWQRESLTGTVLDRHVSYWKQQLEGTTEVLKLPTDRARPTAQTFRGGHHTLSLTQSLSRQLKDLSRKTDVTLFMTLLAAWQTLLYHYTGQEHISVGTPIANRNRVATETLIGFFVNTLVMHGDLSHDPSFRDLLRRVREVSLGAYAHQDMPFEKLVEVLQPERSLSHMPLIQVWFAFQNAPESKLELAGLSLTLLEVESSTAKFDLGLNMTDTAQGLIGTLEYKTDLFNASTTSRLLRQFEKLLGHIVEYPDARLSTLSNMLTSTDQRVQREELQAAKKGNLDRLKGVGRRSVAVSQMSEGGLG
jgi:hypothetical protein